jgi:WD40 repeat protein
MDTALQVVHQEPTAPRRLRPRLPRDLETICLKCLHKQPRKRYASAQLLAEDLERYLAGVPIRARPVSLTERLNRWCRRHPGVAALAALLAVVAVSSVAAITYNWVEKENQRRRVEEQRQARKAEADAKNRALAEAQRNEYFQTIALVSEEIRSHNVPRADELLDSCPADLRRWEWFYLKRQCHLESSRLAGHAATVRAIAFSPKGDWLASGDEEGWVRIWDIAAGREIRAFQDATGPVAALAFHPDGRSLAGAVHRRREKARVSIRRVSLGKLLIWDAATGEVARVLPDEVAVNRLEFSRDGRLAAFGNQVSIWSSAAGQKLCTLPDRYGTAMAFSPAGDCVALAGRDGTVKLWETPSAKLVRTLSGNVDWAGSLAFNSRGDQLAGLDRKMIRIWDRASGDLRSSYPQQSQLYRNALAFAADDQALLSCSSAVALRVWDLQGGGEPRVVQPNTPAISCWAVSPKGRWLAAACQDRTVRIWHLDRCGWCERVPPPAGAHTAPAAPAYSGDGQLAAATTGPEAAKVWEVASGKEVAALEAFPGQALPLAISSNSRRVACWDNQGMAHVWDARTGKFLGKFNGAVGPDVPPRPPLPALNLAPFHRMKLLFSPDGRRVAAVWLSRTVQIWDPDAGRLLCSLDDHSSQVLSLAFSPDSRLLATASTDKTVKLWDVETGSRRATLADHGDRLFPIAFSADGARLASAVKDSVKIWDTSTGQEVICFPVASVPNQLAFSKDGRRLFVAGSNRMTLWDSQTGRLVLILPQHRGFLSDLLLSSDGHTLQAVSPGGGLLRWDASPLKITGPRG